MGGLGEKGPGSGVVVVQRRVGCQGCCCFDNTASRTQLLARLRLSATVV